MGVGDTYYTDEQYKFRNIPSFLHSLNGIKTVNVEAAVDSTAPAPRCRTHRCIS